VLSPKNGNIRKIRKLFKICNGNCSKIVKIGDENDENSINFHDFSLIF